MLLHRFDESGPVKPCGLARWQHFRDDAFFRIGNVRKRSAVIGPRRNLVAPGQRAGNKRDDGLYLRKERAQKQRELAAARAAEHRDARAARSEPTEWVSLIA